MVRIMDKQTTSLSEELTWRGFVNQMTFSDISELDKENRTFYFGVDPSADSMTIGNLAAAMMCRVFMKHGYKAVLLVGGATGMIGDPDGKKSERDLKTLEVIDKNKKAIAAQYSQVFDGMEFIVVDNYDWFKEINYLDFLRDIGKNVPMRVMVNREFVKERLSEDGEGISYAEFSYSLIQGYDFLHLFRNHDVTLQVAGADQWGNSIAGVDLIRRIEGAEAHVYTVPLVVNKSTGVKFGKSEGGAVWLDEQKTSVYQFYQFWINLDDEGVGDYLRMYTTLDKGTIDDILESHEASRSERLAQKHLAYGVTKLIHGEERANSARAISEALFDSGDYSTLSSNDFELLERELPLVEVRLGDQIADALVASQLASSKGEARRFMQSNAVYINGKQLPLEYDSFTTYDVIDQYIVLRRGKNANALLKVVK